MLNDTTITIIVETPRFGAERKGILRYVIAAEQAEALVIGPRPPFSGNWMDREWALRADRAEGMARHIAADLTHKILKMFNDTTT